MALTRGIVCIVVLWLFFLNQQKYFQGPGNLQGKCLKTLLAGVCQYFGKQYLKHDYSLFEQQASSHRNCFYSLEWLHMWYTLFLIWFSL